MSVDQQQTPKKYYEDKGYKPQDVALAIVGAGLANAIALVALTTPFTLWNTIVGVIILCILQAYAPAPDSSRRLNLAYAATWSISFLATLGIVFNMIFRLFGGSFPDTDPKIPFTPFPEYKPNTFTPFNAYDVSFFLVWLAIFLIYFNFFSPGRSKSRAKTASPQEQPKPIPETPRTHEGPTPATSGHLSDIPKSSGDEAH
jgi:hypothetical protein